MWNFGGLSLAKSAFLIGRNRTGTPIQEQDFKSIATISMLLIYNNY